MRKGEEKGEEKRGKEEGRGRREGGMREGERGEGLGEATVYYIIGKDGHIRAQIRHHQHLHVLSMLSQIIKNNGVPWQKEGVQQVRKSVLHWWQK